MSKLLRVSGETVKGLSVLTKDPRWVKPVKSFTCLCGQEGCGTQGFVEFLVPDSLARVGFEAAAHTRNETGDGMSDEGAFMAAMVSAAERDAAYRLADLIRANQAAYNARKRAQG